MKPAHFQPADLCRLPLRELDNDRTFAIRPDSEPATRLLDSIAAVGIRSPLRVQSGSGTRFRVMSGFRRLAAARRISMASVPCFVFPPGGELEHFLGAVQENLGHGELTDLECGTVLLKLLEQFKQEKSQLVAEYLPLLGLKSQPRELERLLRLARLPSILQSALHHWRGELVLKAARWSGPEQHFFESLGRRYQIGHSRQKELVSLLMELRAGRRAAGHTADLSAIWRESGAEEVDAAATLPANQRLQRIIQRLRASRYPILSQQSSQARELIRELPLPASIRLELPQHFEGDRIHLQGSFASPEELRKLGEELVRVSSRGELGALFELL